MRENIPISKEVNAVSYSATNENGVVTYYRHENGEKYTVTKAEVPEFLVQKMEPKSNDKFIKSSAAGNQIIHKKGRKILACISILFIALGLYFLYRVCSDAVQSFNHIGGLIATGVIVLALYFTMLLLWIDEVVANRRKAAAEAIVVPVSFDVKDQGAWPRFFVFLLLMCAALGLAGYSVILIGGIFGVIGLLLFLFMAVSIFLAYVKPSFCGIMYYLHFSGDKIQIMHKQQERRIISLSQIKFVRFRSRGYWYPEMEFMGCDGKILHDMYLRLPEYHLMKKYLTKQNVEVHDGYNRV